MKARTILAIVSIALFFCTATQGWIITVDDDGPADFNNIQAAINDANDGDEVVVADGIYTGPGNRGIDFNGLAITVRSENGADNCIIDCNGEGGAFYFHNSEDANSVIDGFTITGGCGEGALEKENLIVLDHNGIGGRSTPTIKNCVMHGNNCDSIVYIFGTKIEAGRQIINCTITDNNVIDGGVIFCELGFYDDEWVSLNNSIIWSNDGDEFYFTGCCKCGCGAVNLNFGVLDSGWTYHAILSPTFNENNMIYEDPCFVDPCNDDFHLSYDSFCINAGDPNYQPGPEVRDMDGSLRVIQGRVDIGADEKCKFPDTHPFHNKWLSSDEPDCWCYPHQCHGDADGLEHTEKGYVHNFRVGIPDLQILAKGWKKPDTDPDFSEWICADFDRIQYIEKGIPHQFKVGIPDLQVLCYYWKGENVPPADCLTDNPVQP